MTSSGDYMFEWIKRKGIGAVQATCKFNISLNTKTLVSILNKEEQKLREPDYNPTSQVKGFKAMQSLLMEISLGLANHLSFDEIESQVIRPAMQSANPSFYATSQIEDFLSTCRANEDALRRGYY
jgi:hypothetical protein